MKVFTLSVAGTAALGFVSMAAFAQATQTSNPSQTTTSAQGAASPQGRQVTIAGCVVRESDYRRAQGAGRGGAAGSGAGVANEFVLADGRMSPGGAGAASGEATSGTSGTAQTGAEATSGTAPARDTSGTAPAREPSGTDTATTAPRGTAYELTGPNEGQVAQHVGRRVEITGMLKTATAGGAPGGPTANLPLNQDLRLQELEVTSVRETSGACPTQ